MSTAADLVEKNYRVPTPAEPHFVTNVYCHSSPVVLKEKCKWLVLTTNIEKGNVSLTSCSNSFRLLGHSYRHEVSHTKHTYVIQHDMGRNWSLYLAELYQYLFEQFELKKVNFDVNDNTLDFVVDTEK
jgi:hypothetical protein